MARNATKTAAQYTGRKAGQGSKWIRKDKRLAIYLRDDCTCTYCGRAVLPQADATLDHVLACELGGTNHESNLVTACLSCNSAKGAMPMKRWIAHLKTNNVDTDAIPARIRKLTKRSLRAYRADAKARIADAGGYTAAVEAMWAEAASR